MTPPRHGQTQRTALRRRPAPDFHDDGHLLQPRHSPNHTREEKNKPLQVMKFGGTSVANAACILNVAKIIRKAVTKNHVVVVVSAMAGVTDKLVEAAARAQAEDGQSAAAILDDLKKKHLAAVETLIPAGGAREQLVAMIEELFESCNRLCQGTVLLRELTLRTRDAIWSLGERLSAPILAAVLAESGFASEAVGATNVVVTNNRQGGADPLMDLTRERCQERLRPLLDRDIVPVTTGFIGATTEGVLTTLGRGGSDYSATIIGASLDADEVIIWTDVDGVLTADPNQVRAARTIPEMSYREAAEHAHFGARVLHPKTLRALMQCDFPLWVRNAFAPQRRGTKITPKGPKKNDGVKAITAVRDVSMITIGGPGIANVHDVLGRAFATTAAIRADVLLSSQSSSQNDICLIVSSAHADRTVEALRYEFAQDLEQEKVEHIQSDGTVAIVTVIGQNLRAISGIIGRTFGALGRQKVTILASAQGSSDCNVSFVVTRKDLKVALNTAHQELQLGKGKVARSLSRKS